MPEPSGVSLLTLAIGLSGWGKVAYDYLVGQPSIKGRVLNVMQAIMTMPERGEASAWFVYLYLTNRRKSPVYILDYQFEVFIRGDWRKMDRLYGTQNMTAPTFLDPEGGQIDIENFVGNQISRKDAPVDYGKPLHGWLVFVGDRKHHGGFSHITQFKVTCLDVFDKRHEIVTSKEEFPAIPLLQDIAGIKLTHASLRR